MRVDVFDSGRKWPSVGERAGEWKEVKGSPLTETFDAEVAAGKSEVVKEEACLTLGTIAD